MFWSQHASQEGVRHVARSRGGSHLEVHQKHCLWISKYHFKVYLSIKYIKTIWMKFNDLSSHWMVYRNRPSGSNRHYKCLIRAWIKGERCWNVSPLFLKATVFPHRFQTLSLEFFIINRLILISRTNTRFCSCTLLNNHRSLIISSWKRLTNKTKFLQK